MQIAMLGQTVTADQALSPYIYVFYVSFAVSFLFTPLMRLVAIYFDIVDRPDKVRKVHKAPVAYLGGVAVFLGWLAGLAVSQFLNVHAVDTTWPLTHLVVKFSIVVGASFIVILGLWDDILGLRPWVKILGQVLAALVMLFDGVGTTATAPIIVPISGLLTAHFGFSAIPVWVIHGTSGLLVTALVVGCCNAANLMDGLDGLCGGVTAVIAAGFLFLAVSLAMFGGQLAINNDGLRIVLALALLGAVLGFVPYNFNPASIFMGDTGSMLLGYCCAVMIISNTQGKHPRWFLASMVIFALPILDTLLAFARRYLAGRPLFSPDKLHFHHQLVARGFTIKQTVLFSYALSMFFGVLGCSIVFMRARYAGAVWMVTFACIGVTAYKLGMISEATRVDQKKDLASADANNLTQMGQGSVLEVPETPPTGAQPAQMQWHSTSDDASTSTSSVP